MGEVGKEGWSWESGRVVRPWLKSGSSEGEMKRKLSGNSLICNAASGRLARPSESPAARPSGWLSQFSGQFLISAQVVGSGA